MKCLPPESADALLNRSLEIERNLLPEFYASPLGEASLRADFEIQKSTKLCDLDVNATLETSEWQSFFKSLQKHTKQH